jgi:hypothetical protein
MRGRGHLHRLTVFVRHENVMRLLEFLGYRQEEQTRCQNTGGTGGKTRISESYRPSRIACAYREKRVALFGEAR